jgi:hypothetical protein
MPRSPRRRVPFASVAFAKFTTITPVDAMPPSQRLDRSNDGQDHTVSPYAGTPASPRGFAGYGAVRHAQFVTRSRGSSRPARPIPHRRRPRPPQPSPRFVTTYDRPFGGLGWVRHTTKPNFGKVEYFCDGGLTGERNRPGKGLVTRPAGCCRWFAHCCFRRTLRDIQKSPGGFPPGLSVRSLDRTYQLR